MKNTIVSIALIVGMVVSVSTSYGQGEPAKKSPDPHKNVQQDSLQMFKKDAELRITNNEKRIAELNNEFLNMDPADRTTNQNKVNELDKQNKALKKKLAEYKYESPDQWSTFQRDFNKDMDKLTKSLKDYPPHKK